MIPNWFHWSLVSLKSTYRGQNSSPENLCEYQKEKNIPFKKGYKQNFTDEIFEIVKIATLNPPTCNLRDSNREKLLGKFYQAELILVRKNGRV